MSWVPLILSFKLALVTSAILFVVAIPLADWLSKTSSPLKPVIESLISMPLVLPPTVIGFYLLFLLGPQNWLGDFLLRQFNISLVFSFPGLVIASLIYSLPFMVHPIQNGLSAISPSVRDACKLMNKSYWTILTKVLLPSIKPSLLTGLVLTFAHTIGEFGIVLMIGGNIPGETRLASIEIYDQVEQLNYSNAHTYSIILFTICFLILSLVYGLRKMNKGIVS